MIENLEKFKNDENQFIFHAGTKFQKSKFFSSGGRVLNFVSIDKDFKRARKKILDSIKKLNWQHGHFRDDIGYKVIENENNFRNS